MRCSFEFTVLHFRTALTTNLKIEREWRTSLQEESVKDKERIGAMQMELTQLEKLKKVQRLCFSFPHYLFALVLDLVKLRRATYKNYPNSPALKRRTTDPHYSSCDLEQLSRDYPSVPLSGPRRVLFKLSPNQLIWSPSTDVWFKGTGQGCRVFLFMEELFYERAGKTNWKSLYASGIHPPFKQGSWFIPVLL